MKIIYIAGKFSAPTRAGVEANIRAAELRGLEVARIGLMPLIPHANTAHPEFERVQPYPFWIAGTLELLRRADAVLTISGWETSNGARGEVEEALRLGKPVFHELADLAACIDPGTMGEAEAEFGATIRDEQPTLRDGEPLVGRMTGAERGQSDG